MLKYFPAVFLSSYLVRILVTGASIGDAIALTAFCGLFAYFLFLETKKAIPVNKDIYEKLTYLEEQLGLAKSKLSSIQLGNLRK